MPLFGRKPKPAPAPEPVAAPVFPDAPERLRSMAEHLDFLLAQVPALTPFGVSLLESFGLVLAEEIEADVDIPGYDQAAVDGYGVRAVDVSRGLPVKLAVVGEIDAGGVAEDSLPPRTAMILRAGAPIPDGVDAVVPAEWTDLGEFDVEIRRAVAPGENISARGSDIAGDTTIARSGDRLTARRLAVLAGVGVDKVLVRPRPRVVVVGVGANLVRPGTPTLKPGQAFSAATTLVAGIARAEGAQVYDAGLVGESDAELEAVVSDQLIRADLIIVVGGLRLDGGIAGKVAAGLGVADLAEVNLHHARAQGFALVGGDELPMLLFPGDPDAAYASMQAFGRPVVRRLLGARPMDWEQARLKLTRDVVSTDGAQLIPAGVRDGEATPLTDRGPLAALAEADALIALPEGGSARAGEAVVCWLLDGGQ